MIRKPVMEEYTCVFPSNGSEDELGKIQEVPFYKGEVEHMVKRDEHEWIKICNWVQERLLPYMTVKTYNSPSSYVIKHVAEKEIGLYVCNGDIKWILLQLGQPCKLKYYFSRNVTLGRSCELVRKFSPNVTYRLSKKFVNERQNKVSLS